MKLPDLNDVIGFIIMFPLAVLLWLTCGWLAYEMISAMLWR